MAEVAQGVELQDSQKVPPKRRPYVYLAQIYARAGEPDLAFAQLEHFLALPPAGQTANDFRLDPSWDPIRNDPRFQKLLQPRKL